MTFPKASIEPVMFHDFLQRLLGWTFGLFNISCPMPSSEFYKNHWHRSGLVIHLAIGHIGIPRNQITPISWGLLFKAKSSP
jgi:hypothetical protein